MIEIKEMKEPISFSRRSKTRSITRVKEQEKQTVQPMVFDEHIKFWELLEQIERIQYQVDKI